MLDADALAAMLAPIIAEEVAKAVDPLTAKIAELEARKPEKGEPGEPGDPGESVDLAEVNVMVDAAVAKAVAALPKAQDGKDGASIVAPVKDNGELCFTLDNGRLLRTGIRDGEKGQDGKDGFGFDDMDACVLDDDRTIELSFRRGEEEKCFTFKWPTMVYRGIYRDGEQYDRGDVVTWGGSLHHCNAPTKGKPDCGDWTLAARKGRDGKDAKVGC